MSDLVQERPVKRLLKELWSDSRGGVQSAELLLIATIIVIGIIPGLSAVRVAIVTELVDLANAITGGGYTTAFGPATPEMGP